MQLEIIDWAVILLFLCIVLVIGFVAARKTKSKQDYFLAGRSMPWWLLGVSMVATTFSADTPNLVTGFVREGGVAKNWLWWSFLLTGMITVFIYSRMWRRLGITTDLEFYELRYSGKAAAFLRGFRALYLGVFFNCLIMGSVTLAAIKISAILFGLSAIHTVVVSSVIIAIYSTIGGLKGVIWTDFFQFMIATIGAIYAACVAVGQPEIGSLTQLISRPELQDKLSIVPDFTDTSMILSMFIIPLAVQWWSVWYPGSEPGGGGYIAQRMLAAKDENHALKATLFFNFAHYALRPWPWIVVALCSLILFPDLESISTAFPEIEKKYLGNDIAYPVMLTLLSPGWLGLVSAALIAAFMSTISTHLNWGSSYIVNDWYQRFMKPEATEQELVNVGRVATVVLMIISGLLALTVLENASQAFQILLLSGAGTGGVFLLRWFWKRINALTEIVVMITATLTALVLVLAVPEGMLNMKYMDSSTVKLLLATFINSLIWVTTALVSKPESPKVMDQFDAIKGPIEFRKEVVRIFVATITIYAGLFTIGAFLYKNLILMGFSTFLFAGGFYYLLKSLTR